MTDLSIVIVSWNVERLLEACISSLYRHISASTAFDIIVVDNASADGSVEMVRRRFPEVTLIANEDNRGFAAGINQGAAACTGRDVLLLNPDTEFTEDSFAPMRAVFDAHPEVGIVGPRLIGADGTPSRGAGGSFPSFATILSTAAFGYKLLPRATWARGIWLPGDVAEAGYLDWVSGASMLVRREVLDAVGGFDEGYFLLCEDTDFCHRARAKGWRTFYLPTTSVVHHEGSSIDQQDEAFLLSRTASLQVYLKARYGPAGAFALSIPLKANFLVRFAIAGAAYAGRRTEANRKRFLLVRKHFRIMS